MVDLSVQIRNIQDKLQQLLKQQALVQKENQQLKKELDRLHTQNEEKQAMVLALQNQLDAVKLGALSLNETEKAALGKRIDGYLKEIDKCIALLNT
jgi:septal ring factor EnvC (AmiA/AmiB activator)